MEGVLVLMIPIVAVGGFFAWMLVLSPVGKAYAEKLRGHKGSEDMLESVEQLRREVAELAERVDFTERLLGQQRGSERLGPPRA